MVNGAYRNATPNIQRLTKTDDGCGVSPDSPVNRSCSVFVWTNAKPFGHKKSDKVTATRVGPSGDNRSASSQTSNG